MRGLPTTTTTPTSQNSRAQSGSARRRTRIEILTRMSPLGKSLRAPRVRLLPPFTLSRSRRAICPHDRWSAGPRGAARSPPSGLQSSPLHWCRLPRTRTRTRAPVAHLLRALVARTPDPVLLTRLVSLAALRLLRVGATGWGLGFGVWGGGCGHPGATHPNRTRQPPATREVAGSAPFLSHVSPA